MFNRLADRVRLRTAADSPAPPVRAVTPIASNNFFVGEEVRAQIDSVQHGGLFKVLIDDQPFLLRLPFHAKAGDTIKLTVTARDPKLKFEMNDYPASPAQSSRLSDAARFITALLAESEKLPVTAIALTGTPLLSGPPTDTGKLASALGNALAESGMFYESHLAQWANGDRPIALLRHEPQARLPSVPTSSDAEGITVLSAAGDAHVAASTPDLPVHRDALPIVRQQLETLETGHVAWRGLVWNDQALEWDVTEHEAHATTVPADPQWQTRVALALPRLGDVSATLLIGKQGVTISVHALLPDTAAALATHRATLQTSLRDAGVQPLAITIDRNERS